MSDAAPPAPPSRRWILWGCVGCGGLAVVVAGVIGLVGFILYRSTDAAAQAAVSWLQTDPAVERTLGPVRQVKRAWTGWNVRIVNNVGSAYMTFRVDGARANAVAEVWMSRANSPWTVDGARLRPDAGPALTVGTLPFGSGP